MKVLVCGGRNVGKTNPNATHMDAPAEISRATKERNFVSEYLLKIHNEKPITEVIGGEEGGAERLGLHWAAVNKVNSIVWKRLNTKETTIARNSRMLNAGKPDLVIAFGSGQSTSVLVKEAKEKGVQTLQVQIPEF
jgi:hypothetical protein